MSTTRTPMQVVNEQHGGKKKLVEKIMNLVERGEEEAEALRSRLEKVSNRKLLRLAQSAELLRSKYGSKENLAQTVGELLGKAKDKDYVKSLGARTPGRLLDMAKSLSKRAARKSAT